MYEISLNGTVLSPPPPPPLPPASPSPQVDNFMEYGTCSAYCQSIGRACTGAWEEEGDTCTTKTEIGCNLQRDSSDVICECGWVVAPPSPPQRPPEPPGSCDEASWPDVDHGLICGECLVLVRLSRRWFP